MGKYKWDDVSAPKLASYAALIKGAADSREGFFDGITKVGQDFVNKRNDTTMFNAEESSKSNTASIIDQIRDGKTPVKEGFYKGMTVSDAKEKYKRDQIALGFRQRAEGRAVAAAGRARAGRAAQQSQNAAYAKYLVNSMNPGGSEEVAKPAEPEVFEKFTGVSPMGAPSPSGEPIVDQIMSAPYAAPKPEPVSAQSFDSMLGKAMYGETANPYKEPTAVEDIPSMGDGGMRMQTQREAGYSAPIYKGVDYSGNRQLDRNNEWADVQFPFDNPKNGYDIFKSADPKEKAALIKRGTKMEPNDPHLVVDDPGGKNILDRVSKQLPKSSVSPSAQLGNELKALASTKKAARIKKETTAKNKAAIRKENQIEAKYGSVANYEKLIKSKQEAAKAEENLAKQTERIKKQDAADLKNTQKFMLANPKMAWKAMDSYNKRSKKRQDLLTPTMSKLQEKREEAKIAIWKSLEIAKGKEEIKNSTAKITKNSSFKTISKAVAPLLKGVGLTWDPSDETQGSADRSNYMAAEKTLIQAMKAGYTQDDIYEVLRELNVVDNGNWFVKNWTGVDEVQFRKGNFAKMLAKVHKRNNPGTTASTVSDSLSKVVNKKANNPQTWGSY